MGIDSVHKALEKKRRKETEKRFKEKITKDVIEELYDIREDAAGNGADGRTANIFLVLRRIGWGKQRLNWLSGQCKNTEEAVKEGRVTWEEIIAQCDEECAGVDWRIVR